MTRQTFRRTLPAITFIALTLSGCGTLNFREADPEKYMGFECEALDQLAESYRPQTQDQIFADVSDLERRNEGNSNLGLRDDARPYEIEQDRERRSIALARRKKGCL
jgi:hypothetical protein